MTLREREELTAAVDKAYHDLDWKLVDGRASYLHIEMGMRGLEVTERLRKTLPDFDRYCKLLDALNKDDPVEPWSDRDIETVLDICSVKATCFGSGYQKETFFKKLKKCQLTARQSERLRGLFREYLLERPGRSEVPELARLMIMHADSETVQFLETLEARLEGRDQRRIRRFREMILNQRKELR